MKRPRLFTACVLTVAAIAGAGTGVLSQKIAGQPAKMEAYKIQAVVKSNDGSSLGLTWPIIDGSAPAALEDVQQYVGDLDGSVEAELIVFYRR